MGCNQNQNTTHWTFNQTQQTVFLEYHSLIYTGNLTPQDCIYSDKIKLGQSSLSAEYLYFSFNLIKI